MYFKSMLLFYVQNEDEETIKKVAFKFFSEKDLMQALVRTSLQAGRALPAAAIQALRRMAQWRAERQNARIRLHNLKQDRQLDQILSFSGRQP